MGLLHPQVACETIGTVAHFLCGVHDAFARLDINGRVVFQPSAHCRGRQAEDLCNVVDGDVFFSCHWCSKISNWDRILKKIMQSVAKWENLAIFIPALADGQWLSLVWAAGVTE